MSHRDSCPDPYEARRAGERAFERGGSRYSSGYECDEADYEYRRGYDRAEERHNEEEAEARAIAQRRQRMAWAQEEARYYAGMQEQYNAEIAHMEQVESLQRKAEQEEK